MSVHPKHISKGGKVLLWDLGPDKKDEGRAHWEKTLGPHQVDLWAVDAVHAIKVEPDRYSHKLPSGMKPGPAQVERERAEAAESGGQADPHFGAAS